MKTILLTKIPLLRRFVASVPGFRPATVTAQAASPDGSFQSIARRKSPRLAFASVLLAFTSFVSAQNADLSNLVPSAGTLDPVFDSATIAYTANVPFSTTSITVTPTVVEVGATVTVNATPVTSGDASAPVALSVGANVITTQVTSVDTVTTKTYTLTVTRGAASTNADLSGLVPSAGTLDPVFDSATIAYTATVQFSTSSMTVTPTAAGTGATITVNGNAVASGSPSDAIALSVGANIISTVVTAEDSSTTKTYTLTVTRAAVVDLVTDFQATIASEEHPIPYAGEARFFHVSVNPANPGTGSYAATIAGTNNAAPAFVRNFDGPVLAYKFAGGGNNDINLVAQQGGSLGGGIITFTTTDTTFDGFGQQQAKLWTSTDPGSDLKVTGPTSTDIYNAVPNTGSTGGWRSLSDATGKIDVTSIPAGSLHIYYGAFNAKPSVSVVMRDTALVDPAPDITISNAHLNNDTANRTEYYLAEIDFVTDGVYDEIEFVWNAGSTNGRGIAVVVTEAVADAVAPTLVPAGIVDNVGGGPIISTGAAITYTVTYSEFMDPATIDASDFEIAGTATASIQSVVHFGGVTTVTVLPFTGTSGTLQLQVAAGAVLTDLAGNALDTTSAIADDTIITVEVDVTPPVVNTLSPANGATGASTGAILVATFSENIVKGTGNIEVRRSSDDSLVDTINVASSAVTVSGGTASISLGVVLDSLVEYYVLVAPGAFTDLVDNDFGGITLKTVWSFTTGEFGLIGITADNQFFPALFEEYAGQSWILIGRGREGWQFDTDGQGTPGEVGLNLKSPAGFAPKALSDAIVNDLLSQTGKSFPNDVVIRVMRASTTDGTGEYQELRYTNFTGFPNGNTQFTFVFDDANKFANVQRVNAPAGLPGASIGTGNATIRDHQAGGNNANRAFTWAWTGHNNQKGFSMGQTVLGVDNNNANTFLWEFAAENHAIPYSEVWLQLEVPGGGNNFSDWIATFPGAAGDPSFGGDPDGDGIASGLENFFGTNPGEFSSGLVSGVVNTGAGTFTFTHPQNATPADDVSAPAYTWSTDLATFTAAGAANGGGTTVTFSPAINTPTPGITTVTATVTGTPVTKLFVRVGVTQVP